jgi:hypothetical protein
MLSRLNRLWSLQIRGSSPMWASGKSWVSCLIKISRQPTTSLPIQALEGQVLLFKARDQMRYKVSTTKVNRCYIHSLVQTLGIARESLILTTWLKNRRSKWRLRRKTRSSERSSSRCSALCNQRLSAWRSPLDLVPRNSTWTVPLLGRKAQVNMSFTRCCRMTPWTGFVLSTTSLKTQSGKPTSSQAMKSSWRRSSSSLIPVNDHYLANFLCRWTDFQDGQCPLIWWAEKKRVRI